MLASKQAPFCRLLRRAAPHCVQAASACLLLVPAGVGHPNRRGAAHAGGSQERGEPGTCSWHWMPHGVQCRVCQTEVTTQPPPGYAGCLSRQLQLVQDRLRESHAAAAPTHRCMPSRSTTPGATRWPPAALTRRPGCGTPTRETAATSSGVRGSFCCVDPHTPWQLS